MKSKRPRESGSALLVTLIMLGLACILMGSVFTTAMTYSKNGERAYCRDKALFLADAGLHAAIIKLNDCADEKIAFGESRAFFARTNTFLRSDWGFTTAFAAATGRVHLVSTGRYGDVLAVAESDVVQGRDPERIHALYAHALFAGNSGGDPTYVLKISGTGTGADFVRGDTYSGGKIDVSGTAQLRYPEWLNDSDKDGLCGPNETWTNAYAVQVFTNPLSLSAFNTFKAAAAANLNRFYNNGRYDYGEAFADTVGNGVYDRGEPYVDANNNGLFDPGDTYIDRNRDGNYDAGVDTVVDRGNGAWNAGENWVEDSSHSQRVNGKYDPAGGFYQLSYYGVWTWKTSYSSGGKSYSCSGWPAEAYEDVGDGVYNPNPETFTDQNGIFDPDESYVDDRNSLYDYGTQARGAITGMQSPGPGQRKAVGNDPAIAPPNLTNMYYSLNRNGVKPLNALERWGNDVIVTSNDYGTAKVITDTNKPEHIFIRNPPVTGSVASGGKTVYGREYTVVTNGAGRRLDDYFLEDPADSTYNTYVMNDSIDGTEFTAPMYLNVTASGNHKLYFVDGNVYLHNPKVYSLRFRNPGTCITIVANGNITLSDEFYYNADYNPNLTRSTLSSKVVTNAQDALCLIALKNPAFPNNSGNILIGDAQFGTGGSIHALLYAENHFIDNNLNTSDQAFISVFGNMTAGNQVRLNRNGSYRTRLDITLDERVRNGAVIVPGLPHPSGVDRGIAVGTAWQLKPGTWSSYSYLR